MKRFMTMILIASIVSMGMGISYAGPPQGSPQTPVQVETALAPTFTTEQVSMTGTAAIIVAAPTAGQYRYSVTIKNIGTEDVYIGSSGSVTASTGIPSRHQGGDHSRQELWDDLGDMCFGKNYDSRLYQGIPVRRIEKNGKHMAPVCD